MKLRSSDFVGEGETLFCLIPVICFIIGLASTSGCLKACFLGFILKRVVLVCALISRFFGLVSSCASSRSSSDFVETSIRSGAALVGGLSNWVSFWVCLEGSEKGS